LIFISFPFHAAIAEIWKVTCTLGRVQPIGRIVTFQDWPSHVTRAVNLLVT